jgi:HK97 family phage major capsid protein
MSDSDDQKELNTKMDKVLDAATKAQEMATKAIDDGITGAALEEKLKPVLEASTKAAEEAQELKTQMDAVQKTQEYFEKLYTRLGDNSNGDNEAKEFSEKAGQQMARYLRKGIAVDEDVVKGVIELQLKGGFYGVEDYVLENEVKTLIAGNNPQGGYFIRPERSATMVQRIFETSPVRGVANIETTSSDILEFLIDDDEATSGGWVGETSSRGDTDTPDIGLLTIPVHEQFAQPKATQKMLDDAGFDIESWLSRKTTNKMTRVENTAFVVGDGSQKPKGFLTLPAWTTNTTATQDGVYERDAIEQVNSGTSGAFTGDGVKRLQSSLLEPYQPGAVFACRRHSWGSIVILKDGEGNYLLDPRSFKTGDTLSLLGKSVIFMDDIPIAAADSLSLVYGDFGMGYTIVDRIGFRVIRDELTLKPFIKFYVTKRTGAAPTSYEALKIQKLAV